MRIQVRAVELFTVNLRTRLPFRYGIATMTQVPHVFVRAAVELDGRVQRGFAADHLPPKWFTKNPATAYGDDLREMVAVIAHACEAASALEPQAMVFDLWQQLYAAQKAWADARGLPPLLAQFGVTLVERAVIDAFCRATKTTFGRAVRENALGIRPGEIYTELGERVPAKFLPEQPLREMIVRHTVGMLDALTEAEIEPETRADDGLPESLEEYLREDGITHLKIKLGGDLERDCERLRGIAALLEKHGGEFRFTLDGNENFKSVAAFREVWEALLADERIARLLQRMIFVEQPLHRDVALSVETAAALRAWEARPEMIIDESDGAPGTLAVALASGYAGGSFKNCKGVFSGIANACLIAHRRHLEPARRLHLSAEDLVNVGPVALLQDLAVVATLGIEHAERNGHHYFAGLSQFPRELQAPVIAAHADLFAAHAGGFVAMKINRGKIAVGSLVDAPFGVAFEPDLTGCTRLSLDAGAAFPFSEK